jgi:hypothetical protein
MKTKKTKLTKFAIFCNRLIGVNKPAKDFDDLLNRMTKKERENWSEVRFKDEEGRTILITREFLEQGMTLDEVIQDHLTHNPELLEQEILTIN